MQSRKSLNSWGQPAQVENVEVEEVENVESVKAMGEARAKVALDSGTIRHAPMNRCADGFLLLHRYKSRKLLTSA